MITVYLTIITIAALTALIAAIIYFLTRKSQEDHMKFLGLLMLWSFVADFLGLLTIWVIKYKPVSNFIRNYAGKSYHVVAIVLICLFYREVFPKKFRTPIFCMMIFLLILFFWMSSFKRGVVTQHLPLVPLGVATMIFTLSYFFMIMRQMPTIHLQQMPMFWINTSFLIYYGGTIFLNLFVNYFLDIILEQISLYWIYHGTLLIITHILVAVGLWQARQQPILR